MERALIELVCRFTSEVILLLANDLSFTAFFYGHSSLQRCGAVDISGSTAVP